MTLSVVVGMKTWETEPAHSALYGTHTELNCTVLEYTGLMNKAIAINDFEMLSRLNGLKPH